MTSSLVRMAEEAVTISESRQYRPFAGKVIKLPRERGATYYPPEEPLGGLDLTFRGETVFQVTKQSTLAALYEPSLDHQPIALNFASAKNPGGGFLRGASAQEESIARASTLYAGLKGSPYYEANRGHSGLYTDGMIYSPEVWVFRNDHGMFLEEPYKGAFITAPAVNTGALMMGEHSMVQPIMQRRGRRILEVAAHHGHDVVILGAWGCGVFGNDPGFIAQMFADHLRGDFRGVFAKVVFPIYGSDFSYRAFERVFRS